MSPALKEWTLAEVLPLVDTKLKDRNFDHGKAMFAAASCYNCHRFDGDGGALGPDLTQLSGRFRARDILESVIEPDKVINDQYAAMDVVTTTGKVITGRIMNFASNKVFLNTDMLDPTAQEGIPRDEIEEMHASSISMMPKGLINTLNEEELLDLIAFLLSRGDQKSPMFAQ